MQISFGTDITLACELKQQRTPMQTHWNSHLFKLMYHWFLALNYLPTSPLLFLLEIKKKTSNQTANILSIRLQGYICIKLQKQWLPWRRKKTYMFSSGSCIIRYLCALLLLRNYNGKWEKNYSDWIIDCIDTI